MREFFLPCPRTEPLSGVRADDAGPMAKGRSVRNGVGVGREKLGRLVVLEFARAGDTYSGRGDDVAFCCCKAARCLATLRCLGSSSEESST